MVTGPRNERDLLHVWRSGTLTPPRTPRELFQLFGFYEQSAGFQALVDRVDFSGVTPRQVFQVALQRPPARLQDVAPAQYDPARHFAELLQSSEFQSRVVALFLGAFPEKRRNVFIHVPKCAGTDLKLNLAPRCLSIAQVMASEAWTSKPELFDALSGLSRLANFFDEILIYGHIELDAYLAYGRDRREDNLFTVIRDPIELAVSQANYAVSRMVQDPEGLSPDAKRNLELLGLPRLPEGLDKDALRAIALRAFADTRLTEPNLICRYLGGRGRAGAAGAIRSIVTHDVEVTDTDHYNAWLEERWGIASNTRHNRSDHLLERADVLRESVAHVEELTAEDQKVFDLIAWALDKTGRSSIRGGELVGLIDNDCPFAVDARADTIVRRTDWTPPKAPARPAMNGAAHPDEASEAEPKIALVVDFGAAGESGLYRRAGWAGPEPRHTWTSGDESLLELPTPGEAGDYVMQMRFQPFVWQDALPRQRLGVSVNGSEIGNFVVSKPTTVECRLPWSLIRGKDTIAVALLHPDAARPVDVSGVPDRRLIAFAFESLSLIRAGA